MLPFTEDEWHLVLICPHFDSFRQRLPFRAAQVCVQGNPLQGGGCTARNLQSLAQAILLMPDPNILAEYLMRALAARRRYRRSEV